MLQTAIFNKSLIERYNQSGPRYTSYPTAAEFSDSFSHKDYLDQVTTSNGFLLPKSLSLYVHIPFCDTICFYCACNKVATKDQSKAEKYLNYLQHEINLQAALFDDDRLVEQMHWGGGTPTFLSNDQTIKLMNMLRQAFPFMSNDKGDFSIEIDPRSVSESDIHYLADLGFNRFSLGVQDIDENVQTAVNRVQPIEQTVDIISACQQVSKSVNIDLIYGLPMQTLESFSNTLNAILSLSPDRLSIFNYAHLPKLFKPQRRINEASLPTPEEKLSILQMAVQKLQQAGYVYIGMDHFAKQSDELTTAQKNGKLQRNFQGYTTHSHCDLIGLGVSSISSINNCYSQNKKNLDDYYQTLEKGELPIDRGITLTQDDQIRRCLIMELMCHFELDIPRFETWNAIKFADYFSDELKQINRMVEDELLTISHKKLKISPMGRYLVRNICGVFDKYLTKKQQSGQSFSKLI